MAEPAPMPGPLRCLAARVMTYDDWPRELGPTWRSACEAADLDPAGPPARSKQARRVGYGLALCEDTTNGYWTTITSDPDSIASWWPGDDFTGYEPDPRRVLVLSAIWDEDGRATGRHRR